MPVFRAFPPDSLPHLFPVVVISHRPINSPDMQKNPGLVAGMLQPEGQELEFSFKISAQSSFLRGLTFIFRLTMLP